MKPLEVIRNKAFWFVDFLKGNPVLKEYKDIELILENYNSTKSEQLRHSHLNDLLIHANDTVPFYKALNTTDISQFPVVNKITIKENFEAFRSEKYKTANNYTVATSGSSGTPFKLLQDKGKRHRNIADAIYFANKAGIPIGLKVYFVRVWDKHNRKPPILGWIQNVKMQEAAYLNKEEIDLFIKKLSHNSSEQGIWAYASALDTISKYLETSKKQPVDCNLKAIVACSELLNHKTKSVLENYFNTPVISRYSNAENGILAQQQINGNNDFNINWASYYFEVLKFDEDTPAVPGEPGRLVLTDLFNHCMPIIRYDTGDVASIDINSDKVPVFKHVEGRKLDLVYNTKEELISSLTITGFMMKYTNIKQFQFIQEGKTDYVIKLNATKSFNEEKQLVIDAKNTLGLNSNILVEYIDEVPLLNSGKRKIIVNNYITQAQ